MRSTWEKHCIPWPKLLRNNEIQSRPLVEVKIFNTSHTFISSLRKKYAEDCVEKKLEQGSFVPRHLVSKKVVSKP